MRHIRQCTLEELKPHDLLLCCWESCIGRNVLRKVKITPEGDKYISCKEGKHFLDGNENPSGKLSPHFLLLTSK